MKKSKKTYLIIGIVIGYFVVFIGGIHFFIWFTESTSQHYVGGNIKGDHLMQSVMSPDGQHRLDLYFTDSGGLTVAWWQQILIFSVGEGQKKDGKKVWETYYQYPKYGDIDAYWKDNETIVVVDSSIGDIGIEINIYDEVVHNLRETLYINGELADIQKESQ